MSFVIQQPHSLSNPTDKYRVVDFSIWIEYANGDRHSLPSTWFATYAEARAERDKRNG